jgi:cytochrome c peroxidase
MRQTSPFPALASVTRRLRSSATYAIGVTALTSVLATTILSIVEAHAGPVHSARWTPEERDLLRSLSLSSLEALPRDPSNRYADDPRAAALGAHLFFDARLSGNGKVSCASCHSPEHNFQDDKALAQGVGTTSRRAMPIAGTAYSPWLFWDGRADSQWSQALGPLESAVEHGGTRTQYARVIAAHYREVYETVFGAMPSLDGAPRDDISRVYANIGKAIAAYERRIQFAPARFDKFVDEELSQRPHSPQTAFSTDEEAGLRLFIGKGSCVNCHNGALLTDNHFHNTGVPANKAVSTADSGRATGVRQVVSSEFNCAGKFSDAKPEDCQELRFTATEGPELVRAFKTPSLRNVADRSPYMHAGQITTLESVVAHYSSAPAAPFGHSELKPLHLSRDEQRQLVAFLHTLSGPVIAPPVYLELPRHR